MSLQKLQRAISNTESISYNAVTLDTGLQGEEAFGISSSYASVTHLEKCFSGGLAPGGDTYRVEWSFKKQNKTKKYTHIDIELSVEEAEPGRKLRVVARCLGRRILETCIRLCKKSRSSSVVKGDFMQPSNKEMILITLKKAKMSLFFFFPFSKHERRGM